MVSDPFLIIFCILSSFVFVYWKRSVLNSWTSLLTFFSKLSLIIVTNSEPFWTTIFSTRCLKVICIKHPQIDIKNQNSPFQSTPFLVSEKWLLIRELRHLLIVHFHTFAIGVINIDHEKLYHSTTLSFAICYSQRLKTISFGSAVFNEIPFSFSFGDGLKIRALKVFVSEKFSAITALRFLKNFVTLTITIKQKACVQLSWIWKSFLFA